MNFRVGQNHGNNDLTPVMRVMTRYDDAVK